jgi:hypothetical protein
MSASRKKWEADQMLNAYILDYMKKRGFMSAAPVFEQEAKVPLDADLVDAPQGFLYEWWSVFWDVFNARTSKPSTPDARAFVDYQKQRFLKQRFFNVVQVPAQQSVSNGSSFPSLGSSQPLISNSLAQQPTPSHVSHQQQQPQQQLLSVQPTTHATISQMPHSPHKQQSAVSPLPSMNSAASNTRIKSTLMKESKENKDASASRGFSKESSSNGLASSVLLPPSTTPTPTPTSSSGVHSSSQISQTLQWPLPKTSSSPTAVTTQTTNAEVTNNDATSQSTQHSQSQPKPPPLEQQQSQPQSQSTSQPQSQLQSQSQSQLQSQPQSQLQSQSQSQLQLQLQSQPQPQLQEQLQPQPQLQPQSPSQSQQQQQPSVGTVKSSEHAEIGKFPSLSASTTQEYQEHSLTLEKSETFSTSKESNRQNLHHPRLKRKGKQTNNNSDTQSSKKRKKYAQ